MTPSGKGSSAGGSAPGPADAWLSQATFTPLYDAWLPEREKQLRERLRSLPVPGPRNVLLLNATKGPQLYPSIIDFFVLLQAVHPTVRATSASHFAEIFDLERGARKKGLHVVPVDEASRWGPAELDRFDVVLAVGPSQALARMMTMRPLRPRLVCLDLAFYHQLIEASGGVFREGRGVALPPLSEQHNRVVCYSCQPEQKIVRDLERAGFASGLFTWRWFDYIPLGLTYGRYYRASQQIFDVALLGYSSRDYTLLDPSALQGKRLLFLGAIEQAPDVDRLRSQLDITAVSRVNEDTYARLLSLCRCVALPVRSPLLPPGLPPSAAGANVFLSVVDALASGTPIVTFLHAGIERLVQSKAPLVVVDRPRTLTAIFTRLRDKSSGLSTTVRALLDDETRRRDLSERAIAFARSHMDIYAVLERILVEQVL